MLVWRGEAEVGDEILSYFLLLSFRNVHCIKSTRVPARIAATEVLYLYITVPKQASQIERVGASPNFSVRGVHFVRQQARPAR